MYLSTITEVLSFSLFMSFKIFNFGQIKINMLWIYNFQIFTFFINVSVYRYSFLKQIDNYFKTN